MNAVGQIQVGVDTHLVGSTEGTSPPGMHWCLAPLIAEAACLGRDGHPTISDFLPPVPVPRRMWAGSDVQILAPLRTGDRVRRRSIIEGITWKQGRTGPLCFVDIRHDIENTTDRSSANSRPWSIAT